MGTKRWVVCALAGALCLTAQSKREAYRNAFRAWREADPNLETDSRAGGEAITARATKAAELASVYSKARNDSFREMADQQTRNLEWLRANITAPLPDLSPAPESLRLISRELSSASASASAFANDRDPAIQQLRQAFEREQGALEALRTAIVDRQQAEDKAVRAVSSAELARARAMEEYTFLSLPLTQAADLMSQETAAWAAYYPQLADAARNASTALTPVSALPPASAAPAGASPGSPGPSASRSASPTPLPLSRYVGVWSYRAGAAFHGTEPEVVDVTVHEENGHAAGTFFGRFKLPPGSTGDPVLRFEFSGDFRATLNQTFTVTTSDGATGTIDLIPAGAFNMIEVNFSTVIKAGKIHQGDMLLLKQ